MENIYCKELDQPSRIRFDSGEHSCKRLIRLNARYVFSTLNMHTSECEAYAHFLLQFAVDAMVQVMCNGVISKRLLHEINKTDHAFSTTDEYTVKAYTGCILFFELPLVLKPYFRQWLQPSIGRGVFVLEMSKSSKYSLNLRIIYLPLIAIIQKYKFASITISVINILALSYTVEPVTLLKEQPVPLRNSKTIYFR